MAEDAPRPDVLFIMFDQMRGDCLSLERHPALLTPNMDEVGAKGAHFRRAYTTCASCIPARRSLLTGQFPSTNGMVGFVGGVPIENTPTMPQMLAEAGYETVLVGRHMHQSPIEESYGYGRRVHGSTYEGNDEYTKELRRKAPDSGGIRGHGISFNGWQAKPWQLPEEMHPTNWIVRRSREVLAEHEEGPLFLNASFYAPHPPLIPPRFYLERYLRVDLPDAAIGDWASPPPNDARGVGVDAHRTVLRGEALRSAQAGYFGLINHLDDQLYWLIREFTSRSRSRGRPWLVIISCDHGEMLGDHYYFRKCEPYEGSARIPMLIRGSAELGFAPGLTLDSPVCLEDIMPTLLDLAGQDIPEGVDGRSLTGVLRGEETSVRKVLHTEHSPCYSQEQAYQMLTDGRMKYIWRPLDGTEQLFDLEDDPQEMHDLAGAEEHGEELARWRNALIARLESRPEGFTDGKSLIPGRPYEGTLPKLRQD